MAYFADLTPYTYTQSKYAEPVLGTALNIGWLDSSEPFEKGSAGLPSAVSASVKEKLQRLSSTPVNLYRGWQSCQFCRVPRKPPRGNGEIHVPDAVNDVTYIAPVMLLHYIQVHQYQPPQAFLAAVERLDV